MSVFELYSAYYDLLYRNKDYESEARYVLRRLGGERALPLRILELGCGTGRHAIELARMGCSVHGVDMAQGMVEQALTRVAADQQLQRCLSFDQGDVRDYRCSTHFDAVISLFHVMSYQTSNSDVMSAISTARAHLEVGGLFCFDFWYGPAVLSDRPKAQHKDVSDDRIVVARKTTPTMFINENCVNVRFDIEISERQGGRKSQITEDHRMRYLFLPELEQFLGAGKFELMSSEAWLSGDPLSDRSWYGCVVARAVS